MPNILDIAVSGLTNAALRIANATSNIVNASSTAPLPTDGGAYTGFTPQDVVTLSNDTGGSNLGVNSQLVPRDPAYAPAYDPNSPNANAQGVVAVPNVDISSELVTAKVAQVTYGADAAVIKITDKMQKSLLDALS